jgi:putative ABC transport system permease protein
MTSFLFDLRAAARGLLARPGFTLAAVAALALGTGASTMLFSVARGVLFRPLPYADPARVLVVTTRGADPEDRETELSPAELADVRAGARAFEVVSGVGFTSMDLTNAAQPAQLRVGLVLDGFFRAAGIRPLVGRAPTDEEVRAGAPVVLLEEGTWRTQFAADPAVVGRVATLDGKPHTIVGVAPHVWFPSVEYDAWVPAQPQWLAAARRDMRGILAFGRLRPDVDPATAREQLAVLGRRLAAQYPKENGGRTFVGLGVREWEAGTLRAAVLVLLGAVALVLLVACTNVAHMLLARASRRHRELAVRASLGATRARLARLLVAEGLTVALAGGAAGAALAALWLPVLLALAPLQDAQRAAARLDLPVLLASLAVAAVTGVLAGLWPAFRASAARPQSALAAGAGRSATARDGWAARGALVASEVALASVLLVGAGLLLKSFDRLTREDIGYDPSLVVTSGLVLPPTAYPKGTDRQEFVRAVSERLRATPGVEVVAAANFPAYMTGMKGRVAAPGRAEAQPVTWRVVTPDYFEAIRVPVLAGRAFDATDRAGGARVVVINRALADRLFPGADPIGREVTLTRFGPPERARVVGVVANTRLSRVAAAEPELSVPYA